MNTCPKSPVCEAIQHLGKRKGNLIRSNGGKSEHAESLVRQGFLLRCICPAGFGEAGTSSIAPRGYRAAVNI